MAVATPFSVPWSLKNWACSKKNAPAVSFKHGERPEFSDDSAWLAVDIGKSPEEIKKAKKYK